MKDDLRFGDRCRWYMDGSKSAFIDDCIFLQYYGYNHPDCWILQYDSIQPKAVPAANIERYPRFMEKIEVAYGDTDKWFKGLFINFDIKSPSKVLVWADENWLNVLSFDNWRLIPQKDKDVMDIVKQIENNDETILKELAEIILSAREKVNED